MKNLYLFLIIAVLFTACKKEDVAVLQPIKTSELTEDPKIAIPPFSATMTVNGAKRTIKVIGNFTYINMTARSFENSKANFVTSIYDLNFDVLRVTVVPQNIQPPNYTFVRNSPYNYTFTHDTQAGESYSVVVNGKNFLEDGVKFNY